MTNQQIIDELRALQNELLRMKRAHPTVIHNHLHGLHNRIMILIRKLK